MTRSIDTAVLAALALGFSLLLAGVGLFVYTTHLRDQVKLETIEPRFARLAGLAQDKGQLAAALAVARRYR